MIKYKGFLKDIKQHATGVSSAIISGIRKAMIEQPPVSNLPDTVTVTIIGRDSWENRTYFYLNLKDETSEWSVVDITNNVIIADSNGTENNIEYFDIAEGRVYFELVRPDATECTYVVTGEASWFGIDYYYYQDELWHPIDYPDIESEMTIHLHNYSSKIDSYSFYCENTLITLPEKLPEHVKDYSWFLGGCNMFSQDISNWDLSNAIDIDYMFRNCHGFNQDISMWDVSNVKYMYATFESCTTFNQPLNNWNVSNVITMNRMFNGAESFNQPLDTWNVGNCTDMRGMFQYCLEFNQNLSTWCVMKIPTTPGEFHAGMYTSKWTLPKPNWGTCPGNNGGEYITPSPQETAFINDFDPIVFTVNDFKNMSNALVFNIEINDVKDWLLYNHTTDKIIASSFNRSGKGVYLESPSIDNLTLGIDMSRFNNNTKFRLYSSSRKQINFTDRLFGWSMDINGAITINEWSTDIDRVRLASGRLNFFVPNYIPKNMINLSRMFDQAATFNQDISMWDVGHVTSMNAMFGGARAFNQDLSNWCVKNITSKPTSFDTNATQWTLPKPIWGTCPGGDNPDTNVIAAEDEYMGYSEPWIFSATKTNSILENFKLTVSTSYGSDWVILDNDTNERLSSSFGTTNIGIIETYPGNGQFDLTLDMKLLGGSRTFKLYFGVSGGSIRFGTENTINGSKAGELNVIQWNSQAPRVSFNIRNTTLNLPDYIPQEWRNLSSMFNYTNMANPDISMWDVSNVTNMEYMFEDATGFNRDLSSWCVTNMTMEPYHFRTNTPSWTLPKPVWGTCPSMTNNPEPNGDTLIFTIAADNNVLYNTPFAIKLGAVGDDWQLSNESGVIASATFNAPGVSVISDVNNKEVRLSSIANKTSTYTLTIDTDIVRFQYGTSQESGSANISVNVEKFSNTVSRYGFILPTVNLTVPEEIPSNVTSFSEMFAHSKYFNQDISMWDTSNVTDMYRMFNHAERFNQDLNGWDVSNVTTMEDMFLHAYEFNGDITRWNVSNVTTMSGTFNAARGFNQDIGMWDVGKVTTMRSIFFDAGSFNQDLSGWNVLTITEEPISFYYDYPTESWILPKPVWGTFPPRPVSSNVTAFTHVSSNDSYNHGTKSINVQIQHPLNGEWSLYKNDVLVANESIATDANVKVSRTDYGYTYVTLKFPTASTTDFEIHGTMEKLVLGVDSEGTSDAIGATTTLHSFSDTVAAYEFNYARNNIIMPDVLPTHLTDLTRLFFNCNYINQDLDMWDVSHVTNMKEMFYGCDNFNGDIRNWDVSNVTNMDQMLDGTRYFNRDLSNWCVSNITSEPLAFSLGERHEAPKPVWGTCPVPKPERVFNNADLNIIFNDNPVSPRNGGGIGFVISPESTDWKIYLNGVLAATPETPDDTGVVTYKRGNEIYLYMLQRVNTISVSGNMEHIACSFNAYGAPIMPHVEIVNFSETINGYSINSTVPTLALPLTVPSVVTNMNSMFKDTKNITTDISNWDVSNVVSMDNMFENALEFNQDLSNWLVPNISSKPVNFDTGAEMWALPRPTWGNGNLEPTPITPFDFNMTSTEYGGFRITIADTVTEWSILQNDVVIDSGTEAIYEKLIDSISAGDVNIKVYADADYIQLMYTDQALMDTITVNDFGTVVPNIRLAMQEVPLTVPTSIPNTLTNLTAMFATSYNFDQDISMWDVSNVTNMSQMFSSCFKFNQDISNWNVSNVTNMSTMFNGASNFNQNISNWNVSNVTTMSTMFNAAAVFNQPIGSWNVSNVTNMVGMFEDTTSFNQPLDAWDVSNVIYMNSMFRIARAFNQDLSSWNVAHLTYKPDSFDQYSDSWILPKPVWGTAGSAA